MRYLGCPRIAVLFDKGKTKTRSLGEEDLVGYFGTKPRSISMAAR